jgi:hypothetical protein
MSIQSDCELFEYSDLVSSDCTLKDASIWKSYAKESKNIEECFCFSAISCGSIADIILMVLNLEGMVVALILIANISDHEIIESSLELNFTLLIRKIEPFQILHEKEAILILNTGELTTFVNGLRNRKHLSGCMCDYFSPS